ncbi:tetratricopeptide repeat protein [Mycolicibacterium vaccae]|uniref:tetratricopeptide repeat protein n=1 Tax=Mycolicibacterium vaccae TaxID=1810 RepID=UPI003CFE2432
MTSEPIQQTLAAQASLRSRDYQGAASAAWAALSTDPNNEHAMRLYTLALNGQGRTAEALSMAWQTAGAHPQSPLAQYTYASLLLEANKPQHALTVVNEALRLDPSATDSVVLLGDIQRSMGNRAAAEAAYQAALRLEPTHAVAVHNLSVSLLRWGTLTEAVRGLLEVERLNPALAPLALQNISLAVTRVMRMTTAGVVLLAVALIVVSAAHDDSLPTAVPRIAAAALCVPLALGISWVVRTVPRPTLRAVLRRRVLLGVRVGFVALAIVAGVIAAVFGPSVFVTVAGPLLLLGVVALTVVGWVGDA